MRIILISDTHSRHRDMLHNVTDFIDDTKFNVLIHSGDCTNIGRQKEVEDFVYWFQNLKGFDEKIFIAGNHDWAFENHKLPHHKGDYDWFYNLINEENLSQSDVTYLEDSEIELELPNFTKKIKFYGIPWQPEFYNWAFNLPRNGVELEEVYNKIPNDVDVLITHGPPHGILDITPHNLPVGCELLINKLNTINPIIHVFGHIHHSYGVKQIKDTLFVNASTCTERYVPINKPHVIDVVEENGKLITNYVQI